MPQVTTIDYEAIFQALPASYILFDVDDPDFTIVAQNKAHAAVAMVKPGSVVGKPLLKAFPDTSAKYKKTAVSDLVSSLQTVLRTGKPDPMEALRYDLRRPDGKLERRYWRATHHPIRDDDGNIILICQSTADISAEVSASRKLDEARRQLDEALSVGKIGTWLWDLKDDYIVADKNLLRLFGLSPEEAADGLPLQAFTTSIHAEDRPRVMKVIEETIAAKSTFEQEYRTLTKSGEVRWVIARGRVETDDEGQPVRFPGVIVDITERKQTERNLTFLSEVSTALASSLDLNKTLLAVTKLAVPGMADWCSIDILDDDGNVSQVAIAHKDPKKVAWAKRFRKERPVRLDDPGGVAAVLRTGKAQYYPEISDEALVAMSSDAKQLELVRSLNLTSLIIVPLKIRDETVGAVSLVSSELKHHYTTEDLRMAEEVAHRASLAISNAALYETAQQEIAARAKLEEQLREANEALEARVQKRTAQLQASNRDLERSNQELQDFAYVASHDLQEPLRKIQAFGNLLEDEYGGKIGDGKDYLDRMRNAASRMSVLIEDLLAFSRVTTKASPPAEVDLNRIVSDVLSDLEIRIQDTGGRVEVGKLPTIEADPMQMRQLLQNLIGNALKFRRPDVPPVIRVHAKLKCLKDGTIVHCQLLVEDNGIGFDEKYLDRIFAVFQRLHGRDIYQGTGIGLAICRKIAERHGGSITAKSRPGRGSTFIISLPCRQKGTARRA